MKPAEEIIGAVGLSTMVVRPGDTCVAMGISDLPILASPHIMHSMESASVAALSEYRSEERRVGKECRYWGSPYD